jgi:hypothetical protein
MFDLRLIRAEILKLRKRPGMLAISAFITVISSALAIVIPAIMHSSNPIKNGPAGGVTNYTGTMSIVTLMIIVVGAIVGSTAGAQDIESGVFRDSAATGRSRMALFGARIPGALAIVLPMAALSAAIVGVGGVVFAGSLAVPSASIIIGGTAAALAAAVLSVTASVALAALTGSRGPVIGIVLAFELAISKLLVGITALGDVRDVIPNAALDDIGHSPQSAVQMGLGVAIAVLIAWSVAAFAAGAWKTRTREI